jgi:hypothetical protein
VGGAHRGAPILIPRESRTAGRGASAGGDDEVDVGLGKPLARMADGLGCIFRAGDALSTPGIGLCSGSTGWAAVTAADETSGKLPVGTRQTQLDQVRQPGSQFFS